jgi:hypothetical protein
MARPSSKWKCPKCSEPQFGKPDDLCQACIMESKGHWPSGKRHCWDTFGNIIKGDTRLSEY